MQRISRIILATLLIISLKAHTALPDHSDMDAVLTGCMKADNYALCFSLCGMMHDSLKPLIDELDELKGTLDKEMIKADIHENDARKESIQKELDAIATKKQFYLNSLQRCYKGKSTLMLEKITNILN
jgi:hypothetical protein